MDDRSNIVFLLFVFLIISPPKLKIHLIKMSRKEQKNYFEILKRYERKFETKETEMYKILVMRNKDDEDLDKLAMDKLRLLYEKYHVNRERKNYDHLFKKPEENSENH